MCEVLFILQSISVTNIILIMFMISVLSVCCCALLNFESFIHGHFLCFFLLLILFILLNMFLFCWFLLLLWGLVFLWFGLLVPLNGIKKYLA